MKYFFSWPSASLFCPILIAVVLMTASISCATEWAGDSKSQDADRHPYSPSAVAAAISREGRLYTATCHVHKIVLFTDEAQFNSPLIDVTIPGNRKVAIPIDVTIKGYVDFSQFDADAIEIHDSICRITLPDPHVVISASKIDHAAVRQYVSMTRSHFSDADINRLAAQGEDTIANHLASYGIIERSRESCARTLRLDLARMGYKQSNVIIRFRKDYTNQDLRALTTLQ